VTAFSQLKTRAPPAEEEEVAADQPEEAGQRQQGKTQGTKYSTLMIESGDGGCKTKIRRTGHRRKSSSADRVSSFWSTRPTQIIKFLLLDSRKMVEKEGSCRHQDFKTDPNVSRLRKVKMGRGEFRAG